MWIMTAHGWKELQPSRITPAEAPKAFNGVPAPYEGSFPSKELCEAFNKIKEQMKFFDDGVRMAYGRGDRKVETDNSAPANIIPNPPQGWEQWQTPQARSITFNTGRLYTAEGQIVKATLHDDMVVTFFDHSRQVDGEFKLCGSRFDAAIVMDAYDNGIAKGTRRSWSDGMLKGGCNAL